MKFLKYTLIGLGVLLVIYLILCAVGPKKFTVNKSLTINASAESIWAEMSDFKQWEAWSPWHKYDSAMVNTYTGTPGEIGHTNSWTSKVMGNGSQEIVEVDAMKRMRTALKFADWGEDAITYSDYMLVAEGEGTKATWTMDGSEIPFMFRGLMTLMGAQASVEKDYENGLAALKTIVEAKPKIEFKELVTEEITIEDIHYVGKRYPKINESAVDSALFGNSYMELGKFIGGMDKMTGAPFSIGHHYDPATHEMDLEIAVQVASEMKPGPGITSGKIPAGKAIKYVYYGPYEKTAEAWQSLMVQVGKSHKIRWSGYEVYVDDPAGKDMSQVATWLIVPVE
jgi:effector-binding domain-containing protein